jgi:3-hydroxyacyl-CoA dehydrogenase
VKQDHFGRLDEIVKDEAIFATNTSTLTVTGRGRDDRPSASSGSTSSTRCTR